MHRLARWTMVGAALAMPTVAWLTQRGFFGGDISVESGRFPTLLVPAAYAFAIWGLIFILDILAASWLAVRPPADERALFRVRRTATAAFVFTALWMPVFTQQLYAGAVAVIWAAWAAALAAAILAARDEIGSAALSTVTRVALGLHAGWLTLAAFVNTAQLSLVLVLTTETTQWQASAFLWVVAALVLLSAQRVLASAASALLAFTAAVLWGLVAVIVEQQNSNLPGAQASAGVATAVILLLCLHGLWQLQGGRSRSIVRPQ